MEVRVPTNTTDTKEKERPKKKQTQELDTAISLDYYAWHVALVALLSWSPSVDPEDGGFAAVHSPILGNDIK